MRQRNWHLSGKTIVITGAAGGIGAVLAQHLATHHTRLALFDVRGETTHQMAQTLAGETLVQQVDITQQESLAAAVTATYVHFGHIDVVVANAGIVTVGSVEYGDPLAFAHVINVNLLGTWNTVRATLPHLIASHGYLLFVSSLAGTIQAPLQSSYNASKAGIQALANTLRLEVQGLGVDVGIAFLMYTATETARAAVEHPLMRLPGLRVGAPDPVEKTADLLIHGIERRSRVIATPPTRVAMFAPDLIQRTIERMARRNKWATAIQEQAPREVPGGE